MEHEKGVASSLEKERMKFEFQSNWIIKENEQIFVCNNEKVE